MSSPATNPAPVPPPTTTTPPPSTTRPVSPPASPSKTPTHVQSGPASNNAGNTSPSAAPFYHGLTDSLLWSAICAVVLVVFIALITFQSDSPHWPLANLTVPTGILLLTVLAKLTDWALESLGGAGWEKLYWGPILHRGGNLLTHLVMTSGLSACWKVFWNPIQAGPRSPSRIVNFFRRWFQFKWPRFWAFWRIAVWLMIQFPGIIIMSSANTETAYRPAGWSTVSGGVGIFNSSEAFQIPGDFTTNSYIFNILQDTTMAIRTEPAGEQCRSERTCRSVLLVGGLKWIAPWPYTWLSDPELTVYLTQNMPVYQLEGRNTTFDRTVSWNNDQCRVYQASESAIQICAKESNQQGSLTAGIRVCDPGQLDEEGDCTLNPDWPGWNSFIAISSTLDIYRRTVNVAADRQTSTILEITDKGEPTLQNIPPGDFLDAFDNLLCPFSPQNSTISRYCAIGQARSDLTLNLYALMYNSASSPFSHVPSQNPKDLGLMPQCSNVLGVCLQYKIQYSTEALESSTAVDTLRNLFATALFLYNPVFSGAVLSRRNPIFSRTAQEGLADENYFPGSAARASTYIAPAFWTVIAFTASAAFLICASLAATVASLGFRHPRPTAFGTLDIFQVELVQPNQAGGSDVESVVKGKPDKEALEVAEGQRIRLKQV